MDFRCFDNLAADAPWVVEDDRLAGHLLDSADIEEVLRVLGEDAVVFLRLDEALRRIWTSAGARRPYQETFEASAKRLWGPRPTRRNGIPAMEEETGPASGESRGPLRP